MDDKYKIELNGLRSEIDRLKVLRADQCFALKPGKDFAQELPIPSSVRARVLEYAKHLEVTDYSLLDMLWLEARSLLLYDTIYADVDAEHDLSDPILSRAVRGCIDHAGRVPDGTDRDALFYECPEILAAIESAYQKHARPSSRERV